MLDSDVDSLWDDSSVDVLVHDNTDCVGCDVENLTGLSMVEFMGHALVDGTVGDDIDVVTDLVGHEVPREWSGSVLLVWLCE